MESALEQWLAGVSAYADVAREVGKSAADTALVLAACGDNELCKSGVLANYLTQQNPFTADNRFVATSLEQLRPYVIPAIRGARYSVISPIESVPGVGQVECDIPVGSLGGDEFGTFNTFGGLQGPTCESVRRLAGGMSTQELAMALIKSGQLTLGPSDFSTPEAQQQLALALQWSASPVAGPSVGGGMTVGAPWLGIGGTTPFAPFGTASDPFLTFGTGTVSPVSGFPDSSAIGGILGGLVNIGGQYFLNQQAQKAQQDLFKQQLRLLQAQQMAGQMRSLTEQTGNVVVGANGQITVGGTSMQGGFSLTEDGAVQGPVWTNVPGGACCGTRGAVQVDPMVAPGIYRTGCGPCGTQQLQTRNRFYALRADGTKDLFVKVGKVASVSPRTLTRFAKRWAREAGLTTGRRGAGRKRARRRPR